jgi:hypothetical protein
MGVEAQEVDGMARLLPTWQGVVDNLWAAVIMMGLTLLFSGRFRRRLATIQPWLPSALVGVGSLLLAAGLAWAGVALLGRSGFLVPVAFLDASWSNRIAGAAGVFALLGAGLVVTRALRSVRALRWGYSKAANPRMEAHAPAPSIPVERKHVSLGVSCISGEVMLELPLLPKAKAVTPLRIGLDITNSSAELVLIRKVIVEWDAAHDLVRQEGVAFLQTRRRGEWTVANLPVAIEPRSHTEDLSATLWTLAQVQQGPRFAVVLMQTSKLTGRVLLTLEDLNRAQTTCIVHYEYDLRPHQKEALALWTRVGEKDLVAAARAALPAVAIENLGG